MSGNNTWIVSQKKSKKSKITFDNVQWSFVQKIMIKLGNIIFLLLAHGGDNSHLLLNGTPMCHFHLA